MTFRLLKPEADMDLVGAESTFNAMEAFYKVYHSNSCYECVSNYF